MCFHIKKLTASGENKTDSSIEFSPFLTIISGASNTGKTYIFKCLNYLFGSSKLDINLNTGYTNFEMIINYKNKDITFKREIGSTKIFVNSNHPNILSGTYYTTSKKENNINSIYLKLFGINDSFKVPFNSNFESKNFSFRMFIHMLMVNEKEIERDLSIILPKETTNKTYFLSHLLFLLYKTDFSIFDFEEDIKKIKIRKEAITKYIEDKLLIFENMNKDLKTHYTEKDDLQCEINKLNNELKEIEKQITFSFEKGQYLLNEININNEKLVENSVYIERYESLQKQYLADINRLLFIEESQQVFNEFIQEIPTETFVSEINRTSNILADLNNFLDILTSDINNTRNILSNLEKEKIEFDNLVKLSLAPKKIELENKLNEYTKYTTLKSQIEILDKINAEWYNELTNIKSNEENNQTYDPLNLFLETFFDEISSEIQSVLKECNYSNYKNAYFSKDDFDIHINNNSKSTNGKGFSAFFNTVLILSFRNFLYKFGEIIPPFYIIDSPLLGLDIGKTNINKNDLIKGIYNYLIKTMKISQLIIFENEKDLPDINLDNDLIKHYVFTHNKEKGRYGFLNDYHE